MASVMNRFPQDVHLPAGPGESGLEMLCVLGEPGVLSVRGEVDLSTAEDLRRCLHVLATDASPIVSVDLASVTFMSCAGLAPLVEARRQLGRRLRLRAASPAVHRLLRLTELTAYFALHALPGPDRQ